MSMRAMGIAFAHIGKNKKEKQRNQASPCHNYLLQMLRKRSLFALMSKRTM